MSERVVAITPARLASHPAAGRGAPPHRRCPHAGLGFRTARACQRLGRCYCHRLPRRWLVTDSQGWPSVMTSPQLASGTDRVHAVAATVDADIYVNIQGDEPLLRPEHIDDLLRPFAGTDAAVTTLSTLCKPEQLDDPNAVKVVTANNGRALYFSRARSRTRGALPSPHASTSASTLTVRLPCIASRSYRRARWNRSKGWNNCAGSRRESASTWYPLSSIPSGSIPKRTCWLPSSY